MPLAVGEQGPEYRFTAADRSALLAVPQRGESALDVPVGGTLTQYQLLEGMLVGSANNYADRLAQQPLALRRGLRQRGDRPGSPRTACRA